MSYVFRLQYLFTVFTFVNSLPLYLAVVGEQIGAANLSVVTGLVLLFGAAAYGNARGGAAFEYARLATHLRPGIFVIAAYCEG